MLGELISEGRGKRTGRRVIATDPTFKVEVSFEEMGTILGVAAMNLGTYSSSPKPGGTLEGFGEGLAATAEGDMITWKAIGVGRLGADGSVSYRGALSYNSASPKFSGLNSIAGVFEFEVDVNGNTQSKIWEWK